MHSLILKQYFSVDIEDVLMKFGSKKLTLIAMISQAVLTFPAFASNIQISTGPVAFISGISNFSFQAPIDHVSAWSLEYAAIDDVNFDSVGNLSATGRSVSYKSYNGDYGNSQFWKFGLSQVETHDLRGTVKKFTPVLLWGIENSGDRFLYGSEFGYGTNSGFGYVNFYVGARY